MENKNEHVKRKYTAPEMTEKEMTGHFMICASTAKNCPPSTTAIKQKRKCYT